jgi:aldehyde:ferredoxin oxidoreductase
MGRYGFTTFGTGSLFDLISARRMMPTDNFSRTHFAPAAELNAHAYATRYHPLKRGCETCPVACKRLSGDGRPLPDYDAMSHFTALIGNPMIELAMRAGDFCACLVLDPVSAASALACHREITGDALDPERVLALLLGMGTGEGPAAELGRELAQGAAGYAATHGHAELAMAVKGLELPAYDPRGAYGLALAYAVATHGGSTQRANPISHEVLRKPVATDRFSFAGKARGIKLGEDAAAAADSLALCPHMLLAAGLEEYARAFAAVTGHAATGGGLMACGARIDYQERLMNARNGFSAPDDDLPARFFNDPGSSSPDIPVPPLPRQDFLAARAAYYRIRGLTPDGLPTPEAAAAHGLPWPGDLPVKPVEGA